ncbi:hypothetical protein GWI34_04125 [Actinomadura sp. DSM 109109]|nr:hypothetical protein [Actinomadura lepetitiana]
MPARIAQAARPAISRSADAGFFGTIATIPIPIITLTCNIGGYLAAVQVSRR